MLAKCANPACSTPLIYLREGKVFMVENPGEPKVRPQGPILAKPKPAGRVEHFWLCGPCSAKMTLTYNIAQGVSVVPKIKTRTAAAS
ncbi:MAG TPA: hypothetical protein VHA33_25520 [Candidatus Angelobacter sp.]|jgi:hypothetical protein|nr:hypothetical protein [Candidatus Angelobacter sp.]